MNCFSKFIFLHLYNELKFHISSRDGKCSGYLSPGLKVSISSKSRHSTFVLSTIDICSAGSSKMSTDVANQEDWYEFLFTSQLLPRYSHRLLLNYYAHLVHIVTWGKPCKCLTVFLLYNRQSDVTRTLTNSAPYKCSRDVTTESANGKFGTARVSSALQL